MLAERAESGLSGMRIEQDRLESDPGQGGIRS
jgi:hypothetical protein